jgi:hypothetical protein
MTMGSYGVVPSECSPAFDTIDLSGLFSHCSSPGRVSLSCQPESEATKACVPRRSDPVDDAWSQLCASVPPNPTPPPASQIFFDELMSQKPPDVEPSQFFPLVPTPAAIINHHDERSQTREKQAKLEMLRKHREEVRKLEAELSL